MMNERAMSVNESLLNTGNSRNTHFPAIQWQIASTTLTTSATSQGW